MAEVRELVKTFYYLTESNWKTLMSLPMGNEIFEETMLR